MAQLSLLVMLCILLVGPPLAAVRAGKVLLLPLPEDNSHIYILRRVHDELLERGHTPYVSISNCIYAFPVMPNLKFISCFDDRPLCGFGPAYIWCAIDFYL